MRSLKLLAGLVMAVAMLGLGAATPLSAQDLDKVSLRLSWYLSGYHAAYYLGRDRGFYEEEGIDIDLNEGRGSANTVQLVASKSDTFGISDASAVILAAGKGIPVKTIVSLMNSGDFAVIALADRGIKSPEDMRGKRIALSPGDALTQLFPAVLAANGMSRSDVNTVMIDPAGKMAALLEGRVDAMLGGVGAQAMILEVQGFDLDYMRFADIGLPSVGLVIHTHTDTIEENPDLVRRFVKASVRSWEAAVADPDAAVQAAIREKPDLTAELVRRQFDVVSPLLISEATKGQPIGYGAFSDWQRTLDLMKEYRELVTDMEAPEFFTNEFLPSES